MRKTKIIATLGPASTSEEMLRSLMLAGVNVFRLNFSHGSHEIHANSVKLIDKLNAELGLHVATLADLSGPKIRTGVVEGNALMLNPGDEYTITCHDEMCKPGIISVNYQEFASDVKPGEDILLDDGKLLLKTISSNGKDQVIAKVVQGGLLSSRKGVNLPNTSLSLPSLSDKDLDDLRFILTLNIQWVALSFVRTASDIDSLRKLIMEGCTGQPPRIVAKIEKPEAVANAVEIIRSADAIMIARGDLGVETPQEQVPVVQKRLARLCIAASKPIIVATQMMEGMISSMRPTRAEVSDVANSVLDGADALMLSGETSVGAYPVQTVETMSRIIKDVETYGVFHPDIVPEEAIQERKISDSVIMAACDLAKKVNARALIAMTHTGYSAFKLASHRTGSGIYIFSNSRQLLCSLSLVWGVEGIFIEKFKNTDTAMVDMKKVLMARGYITTGNYIIYVSSIPIGKPGKTNMLKLSIV
ncbi:MAG: pyruvate kinase [Lentimicrobium sp.]|nr:pyruvate kinase [Lentimicrobium sp.]HPG33425.1 pyruvate kinase [Lentimicrobium sp.]